MEKRAGPGGGKQDCAQIISWKAYLGVNKVNKVGFYFSSSDGANRGLRNSLSTVEPSFPLSPLSLYRHAMQTWSSSIPSSSPTSLSLDLTLGCGGIEKERRCHYLLPDVHLTGDHTPSDGQ